MVGCRSWSLLTLQLSLVSGSLASCKPMVACNMADLPDLGKLSWHAWCLMLAMTCSTWQLWQLQLEKSMLCPKLEMHRNASYRVKHQPVYLILWEQVIQLCGQLF